MVYPSAGAVLTLLLSLACASVSNATAFPGRTLQEDLEATELRIVDGYVGQRPRLLFSAEDLPRLRERAKAAPERWAQVVRQTRSLKSYVPDMEEVRTGSKYWRAPYMLSGAIVYSVDGDEICLDATVEWMKAHCRSDVWGTGYRSNVDLQASWFLYYISLCYDILYDKIPQADREMIRDSLAEHAEAIYESLQPPQDYRFDQNHTYIPASALATAGYALMGETPRAHEWARFAYALLRRCRYVLGEDGYYYEGSGYWAYALHWHERYARILSRATGEDAFDLPILRKNYLYALHIALPGSPFLYDIGDTGKGALSRPGGFRINRLTMLYGIASALRDGNSQAAADRFAALGDNADDPSMYFLRYDPTVPSPPLAEFAPYHHFTDHDVVFWRSGWGADATCYMFRCGPPQGHLAAEKLKHLDDWTMNSGHVHPDIGAFWVFAKGRYLAVDTGYTASKRTDDHNTLLVDGVGQGVDGSYWVYRGWPYDVFDRVHVEKVHLGPEYGYAAGDMSAAYPQDELGELSIKRHMVMAERFLLVVDDIDAERAHTYSWLAHSDYPFEKGDRTFVSQVGDVRLVTYSLAPEAVEAEVGPTIVKQGSAPGPGEDQQRGYQLVLNAAGKPGKTRIATLLVPVGEGETLPRVEASAVEDDTVDVTIRWDSGKAENVSLDLGWSADSGDRRSPVTWR